jgi:hypothetical protein
MSRVKVVYRNWMYNFLSRVIFYTMRFIFVRTVKAKFELHEKWSTLDRLVDVNLTEPILPLAGELNVIEISRVV